jgi:hypothetical protein
MPIIYIMFQIPAAVGVGVYQKVVGRFHSLAMTLLAFPLVSVVASLAAAAVGGFTFDQPFYALAFWLLPRTAVYGLAFALLRRRALRGVQTESPV